MVLVSFFFSHRTLSKNLSRNGIGLKVTKFGDTNRTTFLVLYIKIHVNFIVSTFLRRLSYQLYERRKNSEVSKPGSPTKFCNTPRQMVEL